LNGKADALTRRPGDLPEGGDERLNNMEQVVLKPHNLLEQFRIVANGIPAETHHLIDNLLDQAYHVDPLPDMVLKAIREHGSLREITVAQC